MTGTFIPPIAENLYGTGPNGESDAELDYFYATPPRTQQGEIQWPTFPVIGPGTGDPLVGDTIFPDFVRVPEAEEISGRHRRVHDQLAATRVNQSDSIYLAEDGTLNVRISGKAPSGLYVETGPPDANRGLRLDFDTLDMRWFVKGGIGPGQQAFGSQQNEGFLELRSTSAQGTKGKIFFGDRTQQNSSVYDEETRRWGFNTITPDLGFRVTVGTGGMLVLGGITATGSAFTLGQAGNNPTLQVAAGSGNINFRNTNAGKVMNFDYADTGGEFRLRTHDGATTTGTTLSADSSRNVGVGTVDRAVRLNVAGAIRLEELSADPPDPAEGSWVVWVSNGVGFGDDGDVVFKLTAGAVTKTSTLIDFSALP